MDVKAMPVACDIKAMLQSYRKYLFLFVSLFPSAPQSEICSSARKFRHSCLNEKKNDGTASADTAKLLSFSEACFVSYRFSRANGWGK